MKIKSFLPGISIAILISLVAWTLGVLFPIIGGPVLGLFIGLLIGIILRDSQKLKAGMQFTSKKVLQYAVILLGFGLNLSQVFKVGVTSLPIILVTIATALVTAYFIQKLFRLDSEITTLVGVGSSICGGSAIAATAPVIKAKDESIATAISVIFFFNILAALIFPHLGSWLGLSNQGFAIFAGTASRTSRTPDVAACPSRRARRWKHARAPRAAARSHGARTARARTPRPWRGRLTRSRSGYPSARTPSSPPAVRAARAITAGNPYGRRSTCGTAAASGNACCGRRRGAAAHRTQAGDSPPWGRPRRGCSP